MAGAARMHDQLRLRQLFHQQAHAAGVIQMHVGGNHVAHLFSRVAPLLQQGQQPRHPRCRARFHEGQFTIPFDQIAGSQFRAHLQGVDATDAVAQVQNLRRQFGVGHCGERKRRRAIVSGPGAGCIPNSVRFVNPVCPSSPPDSTAP